MNRKPEEILKCCTCYSGTTVLYALTNMGMQAAPTHQLTFAEMLKEVTHIDFTEDYSEMPQHICSECSENLEISYDFIKQALSVHVHRRSLVERFSGSQDKADCSQELEIKLKPRDAYEAVSEVDACVTRTSNDIEVKQELDTSDPVTEERNCQKAKFEHNDKGVEVMPSSSDSHKEYGNNDQKYACPICSAKFKFKGFMHKHARTMHFVAPCSKCNAIFENSEELSLHLCNTPVTEDHKYACPICGTKFVRKVNMYNHIRKMHDRDEVKDILPEKELAYQCDKCPHKYTKKQLLNAHIKLKHSEVRPLCLMCGKSFYNKQELLIHMRRHTGEKPFQCDLCDRAFHRVSELNAHRRIHTGEKPYTCTTFQKSFFTFARLTIHIRSHTGERP